MQEYGITPSERRSILFIYKAVLLFVTCDLLVLFIHHSRDLFPPSQTAGMMPLSLQLAAFLILAVLAELWVLRVPGYGVIAVGDSVFFAIIILFGPTVAALAALLAGIIRSLGRTAERSWQSGSRTVQVAQHVLSFGLAALVYHLLAYRGHVFFAGWRTLQNLGALILCASFAFFFQNFLTTLHQILQKGYSFEYLKVVNWRGLKVYLGMIALMGLLMVSVFQVEPLGLLLLVPPLVVMYRSIKNYTDLLLEAKHTIESLADAVERRDPFTERHSERVARYAEKMGRALKMPDEEVERIVSAAKIHDLGKVSVADAILGKIDTLTAEEFEEIKKHPEVGEQVAKHLSVCQAEADLIRSHHEWYDGSGYPEGKSGNDIPAGSRIIAVAEAFDAMSTSRPYHDVLPMELIIETLRSGKGTQFDPEYVEAFIKILKEEENEVR